MSRCKAFAKINLALVVGPMRPDGKHEVATLLERVELHDLVEVERSERAKIVVQGFSEDTLVRTALERFSSAAADPGGWRVRIEKRIPVASGLGGGSSDAAAALRLANALVRDPLSSADLHALAAGIGSDVPFFLTAGSQLGTGDGTELEPVELPRNYAVLLALPHAERKVSTGGVYGALDPKAVATRFEQRRQALRAALSKLGHALELAALPPNDLASAPLSAELVARGAFRADVTGAGPTVYGLFQRERDAQRARQVLRRRARTWLVHPVSGP